MNEIDYPPLISIRSWLNMSQTCIRYNNEKAITLSVPVEVRAQCGDRQMPITKQYGGCYGSSTQTHDLHTVSDIPTT